MKKILVTGANGFLGQHLSLFLADKGYEVIATGRGGSRLPQHKNIEYADVELTNREAVQSLLRHYIVDVLIHNAALSKPDECENNKDFCALTNVETTKYLLESEVRHFIYMSTDFVFGENGPHSEDAETGPLNFYGESKRQAEQHVKENDKKSTIVRPVFIYGRAWEGMRPSFLHWVKNNIEQQKTIRVVSDQLRTPTYVGDICSGIEKIIQKEATGVYNLAGKDVLSPYEMALKTADVLKLDTSFIIEVTADSFPEPVKRAKRSGLKIEKAMRELGYQPVSFEDGVRLTFGL
ncbi:MAG: family oxidoreductase [Segetibacter sp.]|nr:family oxidoreductase [Segetibacter sp.]